MDTELDKKYFFCKTDHQVFLVAGGWDGLYSLSSTETLVEGDLAWTFEQPLPSGSNSSIV